jgi:drug/metabolite transporter (DMT)-like permease
MEKNISEQKGNKKYIGILLMLACALLWSANGLCIKLTPWNSMVLAGWRGFAGAITLFIAMKALKMKISINARTILIGVCVCATGFLYIIANRLTTAANAIVLQYTSPVWLVVLSMIFFGRKYRGIDYAAVLLTVGGIALFFLDQLAPGGTLGNIIAIIDGCSLGGAYLLMGESEGGNRLSGTLAGLVMMAVVGIPFTFVYPPEVTAVSVVMVAVMGIFMLGLPYALYSVAINYCPPLGCVLISSIEIVLNPVWVWLGTGEMPDTFAMIGSAVILITVTLWCALGGAQEKKISKK